VLGGYEKEIEMQTQERNANLGKLIKFKNQLEYTIFHFGQDSNGLELLVKTRRRS
jgi:hypothetical protein